MDAPFNHYHVDPRATRDDMSGRYPRNFVRFPAILRWLNGIDAPCRIAMNKPPFLLGDSLLKRFDQVKAPSARWGSAAEIAILRDSIAQISREFDANPHIAPVGRLILRTMALGHLRNRADTIAHYEANRSFIEANGRFVAPLIVTGFPRTGTTLLQRLLSEDPATRSPFTFELEKSLPPLKAGADPLQDRRIARSSASLATFRRMMPGFLEKFAESHLVGPTEKEESMVYMQAHNAVGTMNAPAVGRSYFHAMNRPDMADALFRYERNFFTMLDAYRPARSHWVLKAPNYAPYFSRLFHHYPDARVVITHRHPSRNWASICRLVETWLLPFDRDGSFDKLRFGDIMQDGMAVFLSAPLEHRRANPQQEGQIVDCLYRDLMADPIAMVRRIYARFDLHYTDDFERRMLRYLAENRQGRHGRHSYSNAEYGIDPATLRARNQAYYDHYGFYADPGPED